MKITKVNYGKTYSLGNYCSERIDLEASIDETQESVTDAVFQLREYCDQLHKKNNHQLYTETPIVEELEEKITPEQAKINTINLIEACETMDELRKYELIAKMNWDMRSAYQIKMTELFEKQKNSK